MRALPSQEIIPAYIDVMETNMGGKVYTFMNKYRRCI